MTEDVHASLDILQWQDLFEDEKPFKLFVEIPEGVEDRRDNDHGFMYCKANDDATSFTTFSDRKVVDQKYLPMMESLLKEQVENVDRVFFFDWRLRKNMGAYIQDEIDLSDLTTWLLPVMQVHNDQSPAAVVNRVIRQLPDDAEFLLKGRVRVINIWRPLNHAVQDYPLGMIDGSTINPTDMVEADHVRRHYTGSSLFALHNPNQKWYYLSNQMPHEALIVKLFDSEDHKAKLCPHTSFKNPKAPNTALPRESIEVRALVFTYEKTN